MNKNINCKAPLTQKLFFFFVLLGSLSITLSSCQYLPGTNTQKSSILATENSYLFYELYDYSGVLFDTVVTSNASDASKTVILDQLFHSFASNSSSNLDESDEFAQSKDLFSLQINAFTTENKYDTYTFDIDFNRQLFQISHKDSFFIYPTSIFDDLFTSGLLDYFFPKNNPPQAKLFYENTELATQTNASWHHHIYSNYYAKELIDNDFIATPDFNTHTLELASDYITITLEDSTKNLPLPSAYYEMYDSSQELLIESPIIFNQNSAEIALPNMNGTYELKIYYEWPQKNTYDYGTLTQTVILNVQKPTSYTLNKTEYEPGDLVVIKGENLDTDILYTFETDIYHEPLNWIAQTNGHYLFLPLTSKLSPGEYTFMIHEDKEGQETITKELSVIVIPKDFPEPYLKTSSSTASIRNDENQIALSQAFEKGRRLSHEEALWTGPFLQPVGGRISTEYGVIRYTNDAVESSRHNGIDFANPTGTPVLATESGYVRLSEFIAITGNTIFIDHGVGIFSQYYHLETIDVNVGDYVEKGDTIGTIGSTGFSTGPHLHFSMYNNGVYVNPWKFFDAPPF